MIPNRHENQHLSDRLHAVVRLIPAIVVILILATQSFAMTQMGGGDWIEICGENGAEIVRIDGVTPGGDSGACPDCGDCLFCAAAAASILPQEVSVAAPKQRPLRFHLSQQAGLPAAAQYWRQSRGPPLNNKENRRAPTW
ncbi:DUF2946 family protein [Shimia biformata]|uniref:DUF2946 family protein n=1 Tax=Shimia biformata TaxID=1294299 RepID=UPI00194EB4AA|nr:DUF2946 family protein [Shimia biformata]